MSLVKGHLIPGLLMALASSSCVPAGPLPEVAPGARIEVEPEVVAPEVEAPVEESDPTPMVVVGVIISQSGDPFLERFGGAVLEGIKLAVESHNRETLAPVELVVLDDEGDPERAATLIAELEAQGAVAGLGPHRPEGLEVAATARRDRQLLILSPTAPDLPPVPNTYSLNTVDARGAEVMAEYALSAGLTRVGLIYPETPEYRRQASVFREILVRGGGEIVAEAPYPPGTNTFSSQLQMVAGLLPDAVFIPASERDARQIAPQITYYGLADTGAQILGGEGWSSDDVLHGVPARYLEGIIATTTLLPPDPEFGWRDFVSLYEETYRRSIDSPLPALGYDAAKLVLRALGGGRTSTGEIVRRFTEPDEIRGATGWISVRDGEVVRRPVLVRIEDGKLIPLRTGTGVLGDN